MPSIWRVIRKRRSRTGKHCANAIEIFTWIFFHLSFWFLILSRIGRKRLKKYTSITTFFLSFQMPAFAFEPFLSFSWVWQVPMYSQDVSSHFLFSTVSSLILMWVPLLSSCTYVIARIIGMLNPLVIPTYVLQHYFSEKFSLSILLFLNYVCLVILFLINVF